MLSKAMKYSFKHRSVGVGEKIDSHKSLDSYLLHYKINSQKGKIVLFLKKTLTP